MRIVSKATISTSESDSDSDKLKIASGYVYLLFHLFIIVLFFSAFILMFITVLLL